MKATLLATMLENGRDAVIASSKSFIAEVGACLEDRIELVSEDELESEPFKLLVIASGGTARAFLDIYRKMDGPYVLLSVPDDNSLAASMEMLSYVNDHGRKGEILHGTPEMIAHRLSVLSRVFNTIRRLRTWHMGVLGNPNMLINSEYDEVLLERTTGIRTTLVGMDELFSEIEEGGYPHDRYVDSLLSSGWDRNELDKALDIYGAVRRLIDRYHFDGVALRCFDLLKPVKASGCLALAILNSEGIPAACEGDTRSLLSMTILHLLTGEPVFMANPSRIDMENNEMVFAHCTLPLSMVDSYSLDTHFESGISIAVKGHFSDHTYTLFKCRENMKDYFVQKADFRGNLDDGKLCRSQIRLHVEDCDSYLRHPLSNHQMIVNGDHVEIVNEFFRWV